jgi:hypothetical protein
MTALFSVGSPDRPVGSVDQSIFQYFNRQNQRCAPSFLDFWSTFSALYALDEGLKDAEAASASYKVERRGKRPWGHPSTGRARPPRCLIRWQCDSPRLFITSRRSAGRDLGRYSAVPLAVSEPFLSRSWTQMDEKLGF